MKIQITLDIEPAEIPLANEIIATLRQLTANVSVNHKGGVPPAEPLQHQRSASAPGPSSAAVPPAQPPVSPAPPHSAPQQQQQQQQPPRTSTPPAAPVQQPRPPQPQPHQNGRPNGTELTHEQLAGIVRRAGIENADMQAIASEVSRTLDAAVSSGAARDAVLNTWVGAFMSAVFNEANVEKRVSVVPYMEIIPALSDPWKGQTRDKVIPAVLRHLTIKRPLTVDRMIFFAQAEAFAALVNSGLIGISGAVKTIVALLKKPDNRSAAITCLGKTAELCVEQLTGECDAERLGELQAALSLCNEPTFQYDLEYINDIMGWDPTSSAPAVPAPGPSPVAAPVRQVLRPLASWAGNTDTIFSLAYDAPRRRIVTGAKDSQVLVFDEAGQRVGAPQSVSGCFVCSLDIHPSSDLLLVGGVPRSKNGASASCVAAYRLTQNGAEPAGLLLPSGVKMLSFVRSLPAANGFLTGETPHDDQESVVRLYSLAGSSSFDSLQPTSTFRGHRDMITAVAPHPSQPPLFISGARDSQVLLWDPRAAAGGPVGRFVVPPAAAGAPPGMVTCLDAAGSTLLCGTTTQLVSQWDLRTAAQGGAAESVRTLHVDDSTVLKLAIGPSLASVAVTTFHGLYLADFSSPSGSPDIEKLPISMGSDGKVQHYHDVKWAPERGLLHAGGISKAVSTFQLGPA